MGCDIHCFAEKKVNGTWVKVGKEFPNPYYDPKNKEYVDEDGYEWNPKFTAQPYNGRNYDLFGILADVRNGRGFAGIQTGEGFNPISEPKGLPDDVSAEIKKESDDWGGDGHSHSWFTIKELQYYDWLQTTKNYGVIGLNDYKKYKETNELPRFYSGAVSGGGVINLSNEDMDKAIAENSFQQGYEYYTRIGWETTYKDAVGRYFFETTLPQLEKIAPPEEIRIVFWFDN